MSQAIAAVKAALWRIWSDERAQDTFEYVLIIGAVVVAIIIAVATPLGSSLIGAVITGVCNAINGLPNIDVTCPS